MNGPLCATFHGGLMHSHSFKDLTGQTFTRLRVKEYAGTDKRRQATWRCVCSCGNEVVVRGATLRNGETKSCGCLNREKSAERCRKMATHGHARRGKVTPEYTTWQCMIQRCTHPGNISYQRYGALGITICKRWRASFENFFADMGKRPSPEHSIHRLRNDQGYCPSNCVWATIVEQNRHRSCVKLNLAKAGEIRRRYSAGGVTQRQLAAEYGIAQSSVSTIVLGKKWITLPPKKPSAFTSIDLQNVNSA